MRNVNADVESLLQPESLPCSLSRVLRCLARMTEGEEATVTREDLVGLIAGIYKRFLPPARASEEVTYNSRLFGGDSPIDSIALVSLLIEVEQSVNELCNTEIVIADDRAMSQKRSPFRTVESLGDYIQVLLSEQRNGR